MTKPSIVLCHGAWHSPAHFEQLIDYLQAHGYTCLATALPSVHHAPNPTTNLASDIEAFRADVLSSLQHNDVLAVGHSYAGSVTSSAIRGLDRKSRQAEGHQTAVIGLALITAFMLPAGAALLDALGGKPGSIHDVKDGVVRISTVLGAGYYMYGDVPHDDALKAAQLLRPMSWQTHLDRNPYAGWKDVPTSYLIADNDFAIPTFAQKGMVDAARAAGADVTAELVDSAHSPYLSKLQETANFLRRAAGEEVQGHVRSY